MGEHHKRSSSDFQTIIGVPKGSCCIKDACKAYKSMTTRWYPDKNSSSTKAEDVTKLKTLKEAFFEDSRDNGGGNHPSTTDHIFKQHQSVDDQFYMPSFHSRDTSRRSKTPSPMSGSLSRGMSRRSTNSSSLSEPQPLSRSISRMSNTSTIPTRQGEPSPLSRSISRMSNSSTSPGSEPPLSRWISRRSSTTPIMFSYSTARTKPPPVEKQLECTLEELLKGCTKKIKIKKDVITNTGLIVQEVETLTIKVKPGWKKGTKITFDGMGDERPGFLPADIIFLIAEKRHSMFRREENDLILSVQIPLIKALTGCILSIPLLGGEKMVLTLDEIVYPGYTKIISGQGMPNPREHGKRGDLQVIFQINFPTKLSDEQRFDVVNLLQGCT